MTTMNISLPDDMKDWIDAQVQSRGFTTSSEFIRDLILREKEIADFRAMIQEGLDSGDPIPADDAFFQSLRDRVKNYK